MTNDVPPQGLGPFIEANLEPILQEWEAFAHSLNRRTPPGVPITP